MKRATYWPQIIGLILIYLVACVIEPCDGHGCDQEVLR
jgi:hypothetical protein